MVGVLKLEVTPVFYIWLHIEYHVTFWNWLVFQNCQTGEQSYIHVGCSALCLSMSCNYEYVKSIVSCIQLDRCFQFKYHSRKVCSVHWDVFITTVMFPMMKFLGVFSIFQLIHSFYILSISLHLISMFFCSSCDFLIKSKIKSYSIYFVTKGLLTCPQHTLVMYWTCNVELTSIKMKTLNHGYLSVVKRWYFGCYWALSCPWNSLCIYCIFTIFSWRFFVLRLSPLENHLILFEKSTACIRMVSYVKKTVFPLLYLDISLTFSGMHNKKNLIVCVINGNKIRSRIYLYYKVHFNFFDGCIVHLSRSPIYLCSNGNFFFVPPTKGRIEIS
jgi:hypothetical protein